MAFAKMVDERLSQIPVLYDLLLEYNHTVFQIDALVLCQNTVYLFLK